MKGSGKKTGTADATHRLDAHGSTVAKAINGKAARIPVRISVHGQNGDEKKKGSPVFPFAPKLTLHFHPGQRITPIEISRFIDLIFSRQANMSNSFSKPDFLFHGSATLRLAFPVWIAQIAMSAAGFVDTTMAGHYSPVDLAGVATGASVWIPFLFALTGLLVATSPMTAQHFGAGRHSEIRKVTDAGLAIAMVAGLLIAFLLNRMDPVFTLLKTPAEIRDITTRYLFGLSFGIPAMAGYIVLKSQSEAMGDTRAQMKISLFALVFNVLFNWIFVHGKFGMPEMGGAGCGVASALSFWIMFLAMGIYLKRSHRLATFGFLDALPAPKWKETAEIFRVGSPIALTLFMESSIFACITLFIGKLGAIQVAGHQVCMNFSGLLYAIPLSISTAATVRVGQAVGRKDAREVCGACYGALFTALSIAVLTVLTTISVRHWIVKLYTPDPVVQELASSLLVLAATYQISDATAALSMGALRGFKDTRIPMLLTCVAYWGIAMPLGYTLGLTDHLVPAMGPAGFWISLIFGLTASGLLLLMRLVRVNRKFVQSGLSA